MYRIHITSAKGMPVWCLLNSWCQHDGVFWSVSLNYNRPHNEVFIMIPIPHSKYHSWRKGIFQSWTNSYWFICCSHLILFHMANININTYDKNASCLCFQSTCWKWERAPYRNRQWNAIWWVFFVNKVTRVNQFKVSHPTDTRKHIHI